MNGLGRVFNRAYEAGEDILGKSWPVAALALFVYAVAAFVLLTKVSLPSPLHLLVYTMAFAVMIMTFAKIELGVIGLALMMPFARPGFTIGPDKVFHVSGFNVALLGVLVVYIVRYLSDKEFASRGPMFRRSRLDPVVAIYVALITLSTLAAINLNPGWVARARILLYYKEQILYFAWFYLILTLLRSPEDVRRFAIAFGMAGMLVAILGVYTRLTGGMHGAEVMDEEVLEAGVAGGRVGGGWLGLTHANFFAAFLIMTIPIWFFISDHFKHLAHRVLAQAVTLTGFLGILFTYSRSAWGGVLGGIALMGMRDGRTFRKIVLFFILFALVGQAVALSTSGAGLFEVIALRFEQLGRSAYSGRPAIYEKVSAVVAAHPLMGVGLGVFGLHSESPWATGRRLTHAHNLVLNTVAECGLPAAAAFVALLASVFVLAVVNVRKLGGVPGYAFVAQGTFVAYFAILAQAMFVHIFMHREIGYTFFTLVAIVVALNRMVIEGRLPKPHGEEHVDTVWTSG